MKLGKLYELAVKVGIDNDPRGHAKVEKEFEKAKKEYAQLKDEDRKSFDLESLSNPYADTRILNGSQDKQVKTVLLGIDIEAPELLVADRLSQKTKIDLVIAHHPEGFAYAGFYEVMKMQSDILSKIGVPVGVSEGLTMERMREVERRVMPANHLRASDTARLLGVNFMCIHTPADNCVASYLQHLMDERIPETVGDALKILKSVPEYKFAELNKYGPKVILGDAKRSCGKIFVDMTGGTEGSKEIFPRLSSAGVSTLVCMHLSEEHFAKAKNENINVIVAGHISSDNLGLNLLLDQIEKKEKLSILEISGFRRIKR
ncbi:MAG: NGG1p interacting factor NIF3 [Candidatus Omnitrophota bacterium]|nr:NGG1p interacting factor NIF3 [Candidatus Omnitrophota bacterium]